MVSSQYDYIKISELPTAESVESEDLMVVNHKGKTSITKVSTLTNTLNGKITEIVNSLVLNNLYPIGSIYLETNHENPSLKFGGTWVEFGASDTYLRLGGNGDGGSNTTSVTLSADNIPSHSHSLNGHTHTFAHTHDTDSGGNHSHSQLSWNGGSRFSLAGGSGDGISLSYGAGNLLNENITTDNKGNHSHKTTSQSTSTTSGSNENTAATGDGRSFDVIVEPKYVSVYAWKRIE